MKKSRRDVFFAACLSHPSADQHVYVTLYVLTSKHTTHANNLPATLNYPLVSYVVVHGLAMHIDEVLNLNSVSVKL